MDKLKENANNIEFLLLFIPLAITVAALWDGADFDIFEYACRLSDSWLPCGITNDGAFYFGIFGPFVLWKVFAKYHLK